VSRPPGKRVPAKKRSGPPPKKKSKKNSKLPQLVLGLTVLTILAGLGAVSVYMAEKYVPTPPEQINPDAVARPKVEEKLTTKPLKRPGHLVMAPDQIYYPRATDVIGKPIEPPINGLLERGVITMFPDGTFRPDEPIPRAEFMLWCYNALMAQTIKTNDPFVSPKKPIRAVEPGGDEFEDVDADHWALPVLASLKEAHFWGEKTPPKMRPDAPLRREEWAFYAVRFCAPRVQIVNMSTSVDATKLAVAMRKLNYTDASLIKGLYRPYVWFIVSDEKRVMWLQGTFESPVNPGPWHPNKPMTRGEAAVFIGGFFEEIGKAFM
jgi:hypothetical protein